MFRVIIAASVLLLAACGGTSSPTMTPPVLAQLMEFWQPVKGVLAAGETQGWLFAGRSGDAIRVRTLSQATGIVLTLQTQDGTPLTQGAELETTLPADGVYTILIQSTTGGPYELGLGYTDRPNPADYTPTPLPVTVAVPTPTPPYYARLGNQIVAIGSGETLSGTLAAPDERHVYTFDGSSGQFANITLRGTSGGVDPVIALYGPDGAEIASDDNSGGDRAALLRNIRLPADGTYSIAASGHGFTGGYEVILFISPTPAPVTPTIVIEPTATREVEILTPTVATANSTDLEDHVPVIGSLNSAGEVNRFVVFATAGEMMTIGVSPMEGSTLRPKIEVYDPDGTLVATATVANSEAGGDALVSALLAAFSGGYQVFVSGDNNSGGLYIVSYGKGVSREDVRRGETSVDQPVDGNIARRGLRDVWSLYLNAGDVITAAVSPTSAQFDPALELVTPDGSVVARDDNGGGGQAALIGGALAPVSGLYRLRVTAAGGFGSGAYTLVWHYVNLAPTAAPVPGSILILSFEDSIPPSTYQFYTFQGQAGQQVEIRVTAQGNDGFDPVAALLGVDGTVIAEGDDDGSDLNPRFSAQLPADGTYSVRVNGYLTGGTFTLTVAAQFAISP